MASNGVSPETHAPASLRGVLLLPLPSGGSQAGIDEVVASNRHQALELAAQSHPNCSLAAFHSALIPTSRRQALLADWLQTV